MAEELAHARVPAAGARSAQHHRHDMALVAPQRGHEIETGGIGVAGLDAVHAFDVAEQAIVIADGVAAKHEGLGLEVFVIGREALLNGAAEDGLVARGGHLCVVG